MLFKASCSNIGIIIVFACDKLFATQTQRKDVILNETKVYILVLHRKHSTVFVILHLSDMTCIYLVQRAFWDVRIHIHWKTRRLEKEVWQYFDVLVMK